MNLEGALSIASGGLRTSIANSGSSPRMWRTRARPVIHARSRLRRASPRTGSAWGFDPAPPVRNVDDALQGDLLLQNASVAGFQTRQAALQADRYWYKVRLDRAGIWHRS